MSVPVVNHIIPYGGNVGDPAIGPTSGRALIDIWGRNFRLPSSEEDVGDSVTYSGTIVCDTPQSVSVTFGGKEALEVKVLSEIHLRVLTPVTPLEGIASDNYGEGDVDVVVTNLDDDEVAIVGETVTVTNGYTYARNKLDSGHLNDFERLIRTLIREIKRQVLSNVILTAHTEYDSYTSDGLNIVDIAQLPAIVLIGPSTPENRTYSLNAPQHISETGGYKTLRKSRTIDIEFDIVGITNNTSELLKLMDTVNEFMNRNISISMLRDPNDSSLGYVDYEFQFLDTEGLTARNRGNESNIRSFSGAIVIKGYVIEGQSSFNYDAVISDGPTLDYDIELSVDEM